MILDGGPLAKQILEDLKKGVGEFGKLSMTAISYEEDQESIVYFNSIKRNAEKVGIEFNTLIIEGSELIDTIQMLNDNDSVNSVIAGRPFPKGITNEMVSQALDPDKDPDCVTYQNMGQLYFGVENIAPATPKAALDLLKFYNIGLKGKSALVINRSVTVGRPLSQMLLNRDATVTVAHTKTKDIGKLVKENDIIFLAVGKEGYLKSSVIEGKKIIVDIGISVVKGIVKGDFSIDTENVTLDYTPVPGGVGAVTSAEILRNALALARI